MTQVEGPEHINRKDNASMTPILTGEFLMRTTDDDNTGYTTNT